MPVAAWCRLVTAHVAEAAEGRGRVILRCSALAISDVAVEAAIFVAEAFNSEIELLMVEDSQRVAFAGFDFAREFSERGGPPRAVSARAVRAEFRSAFGTARRHVASMVVSHDVPLSESVVRDDPVQALVSACARRGPWNVIAIAEAFDKPASDALDEIFDTVKDATGVIVAGPTARPVRSLSRQSRPVVLAVENVGEIQGMLRSARYLATTLGGEISILQIAETADDLAQMDGAVRLLLADEPSVRLVRVGPTYGSSGVIAETIRTLDPGIVIARFGGVAVPRGRSVRPLTGALGCPLLLVR